jgi:hypothetical protein
MATKRARYFARKDHIPNMDRDEKGDIKGKTHDRAPAFYVASSGQGVLTTRANKLGAFETELIDTGLYRRYEYLARTSDASDYSQEDGGPFPKLGSLPLPPTPGKPGVSSSKTTESVLTTAAIRPSYDALLMASHYGPSKTANEAAAALRVGLVSGTIHEPVNNRSTLGAGGADAFSINANRARPFVYGAHVLPPDVTHGPITTQRVPVDHVRSAQDKLIDTTDDEKKK